MAEEKITIVALRKALAQKTGLREELVGKYLTHLFPAIVAGIREDKQVRINGLGIFKLQWNEPRKSVNIRTGETIMIEGYNKVVFTPDSSLKEQINEPFAHLEAVVIDGGEEPHKVSTDPMQKFGEQAEEIESLLAEIGDLGEVKVQEEEKEEVPIETETAIDSNEETVTEPAEEQVKATTQKRKKEEKPFNAWLVGGITISCFCVLLIIGYFFARHQLEQWADGLQIKLQTIDSIAPANQELVIESESIEHKEETTKQQAISQTQQEVKPTQVQTSAKVEVREYTEFIKTEKLTYGSRLSWLSRKYYGAPDFWVYIYEANKDKLPDPSVIPIGTEIRIPKLPKELINTKNAESMRKAKALHKQILGE